MSTAQLNAVNSGITTGLVSKLNHLNIDFDLFFEIESNVNTEGLVQAIIDELGGSYYPWGIVNSITINLNNHTFTSSNGVRVTAQILKLTSVGDTYNSDYPAGTWAAMIGTLTAIDQSGNVTRYVAEFNWGDAIDVDDASKARIILSKLVTTIPGVNDHVQYYIPSTGYAVLATTSGSNVDYYFGAYGASSLINLVNPTTIYTDISLEDGKFTFNCYLWNSAYSNSVGTRLRGWLAVGRKFFVDALNIMLDKSFTYSQFSSWANANNYEITYGRSTTSYMTEPTELGAVDVVIQLAELVKRFNFGNSTVGSITHYNGITLNYDGRVMLTVEQGTHTAESNNVIMRCTVDLSGFIAQYS